MVEVVVNCRSMEEGDVDWVEKGKEEEVFCCWKLVYMS